MKPKPSADANVDIVEMDAMDIGEWEGEQLTPQQSDAKLAALVKQIAPPPRTPPAITKPQPPPPRTTSTVARPMPAKKPTITIPSVKPPSQPIPVIAAAPMPITDAPTAPVAPRAVEEVPTAPIAPAPRAFVMPLPAVVVPPPTIVIEADAPPPPVYLTPPPPVYVAPPSVYPVYVAPPVADASGAGPYSVAVTTEPQPHVEDPPRMSEPPAPRRSKRAIVLIGGAAACLALVAIVIAASGGSHDTPPNKPGIIAAEKPVADPATKPTATPAVAPVAPIAPPVVPPTDATTTEPAKPLPPKATNHIVARAKPAKKLVLDYDKPSKPIEPAKSDDQSLAKARAAYAAGNQRLFAGDPEGAIRAYQQALDAYPGYVAGYRGLGLAYAQLHDKPSAVTAFKTYVRLVPNAKDVALIQKRIAALSP